MTNFTGTIAVIIFAPFGIIQTEQTKIEIQKNFPSAEKITVEVAGNENGNGFTISVHSDVADPSESSHEEIAVAKKVAVIITTKIF